MEIKLLEHTKLSNIVIGARTCYDSFHKGGNYDIPTDDITEVDKSLIDTSSFKPRYTSSQRISVL